MADRVDLEGQYALAKLIQTQSPRCKWVGSWSNYHSAWEVDGVLVVYAKKHFKAEPWAQVIRGAASLYTSPLKTKSTDPRMRQHLETIANG